MTVLIICCTIVACVLGALKAWCSVHQDFNRRLVREAELKLTHGEIETQRVLAECAKSHTPPRHMRLTDGVEKIDDVFDESDAEILAGFKRVR